MLTRRGTPIVWIPSVALAPRAAASRRPTRYPDYAFAASGLLPPSLAKIPGLIAAAPVGWKDPCSDKGMDRRQRPRGRARHEAVLDRVVMDVVHVPGEIVIVAEQVLPKAALPEVELAAAVPVKANVVVRQRPAESGLDCPPPSRVVGVVRWQGPDRMQMIGKDDHAPPGRSRAGRRRTWRAVRTAGRAV